MTKNELVLRLAKKYAPLKEIILTNHNIDYGHLKRNLGKAASKYFESLLLTQQDPRVGIGGGGSIHEMISSLRSVPRRIRIYPTALIGRGPEVSHVDSTYLATLLHMKSKPLSKAFVVKVPPLPQTIEAAKNFKKYLQDNIAEINWLYNSMQNVEIAFVGLGAVIPTGDFDSEMSKLGLTLKTLQKNDVIGGINYNWFQSNGEQFTDHFLTITINQLKELTKDSKKKIVLVAGGSHKVGPIQVAIETGMVNVLISDIVTGNELLQENL